MSFLKNHIHNIAELISLVIAIVYYPYLKKSFMKWFLPFLSFIFFTEAFISYLDICNDSRPNSDIYDIIGIGECIFYNYIFYQLAHNFFPKKIIMLFTSLSILPYLIGVVCYSNNNNYHSVGFIVSGLLLSLVSLAYLYDRVTSDDYIFLVSESGFWIALGISLFFSCTSIVFALHDFILKNNLKLFGVKLYNFVPGVLSIVLYSCISIAIILCKKKAKIS